MKRIKPALLAVFLLTLPAQARDWEWVSGGDFFSIAVQNRATADPADDVVWLGGDLLVKGVQQDGDWVWTQVAPELTEDSWISGLVFFEGGYAMAQTLSGIAYSSNSGVSWTVHALPDSIAYLNRIQMTGPLRAYAVGRNPVGQAILASMLDGGASWELLYDSGEWPGEFTGLQIYGDGRATLVGNYYSDWMGWLGVIIETADDFQTVSRRDYDDQRLTALEAPTRTDHYALGGPELPGAQRPILVYRHGENGIWQQSTLPADIFQVTDMAFVTALHGWVTGSFSDLDVGAGGVLLETVDGGETWNRTDFCHNCVTQLPIVREPVSVLHYVAVAGGGLFVSQGAGAWPCASGLCQERVLTSSDGLQWDRVEKLTGFSYVDIDLSSGSLKGLALGFDGSFWNSFTQTLSGGSWQNPLLHEIPCPFPGMCPPRWAGVKIIQNSEVWTLTEGYDPPADLLKSLDSGATWAPIDAGEEGSYQQAILSVASPDSIWTAITTSDSAGRIIATSDRGTTWTTVRDAGPGNRYTRVDHVSDTQYCAVMRSHGLHQGRRPDLVLPLRARDVHRPPVARRGVRLVGWRRTTGRRCSLPDNQQGNDLEPGRATRSDGPRYPGPNSVCQPPTRLACGRCQRGRLEPGTPAEDHRWRRDLDRRNGRRLLRQRPERICLRRCARRHRLAHLPAQRDAFEKVGIRSDSPRRR